jgi:hypothetical protein
MFAITITGSALAQVNQRPLSDFINAQGTTTCFIAPVPAQTVWVNEAPGTDKEPRGNPLAQRASLVDFTGTTAKFLLSHGINLGTTMSGTVMERPLADGTALVTVDLDNKNTLAWAIAFDPTRDFGQIVDSPPLFGYRPQDLIANPALTPALGDDHFHVEFTNTAPGAAIPDLLCQASVVCPSMAPCPPAFNFEFISIEASITGPLHAPLWPEGTPGQLTVRQIGLLQPAINNGFKGALADAFPAESVDLKTIGK